ncbi:neural cell adhesion molecule L1-like protein isoform X2 [Pyxicephalus adspersus]|uniref:neural cell adhesion molecule L1-like protein isoform X2 n=1 Tax=Pyxicephalus adspersus TaxID=30357 RepID=UPI003B58FA1C
MLSVWGQAAFILLFILKCFRTAEIPLSVEQLPTIVEVTKGVQFAFPVGEDFAMKCKAKGNPTPQYHWTRNGHPYNPFTDQNVKTEEDSGTFIIHHNGNISPYNGTYRCYAFNKLGTAMSDETTFIVPGDPTFPRENIPPLELEEGDPAILRCDPPAGIPPVSIHWMTPDLRHITQSKRVSVGLDGMLYFSHVTRTDSSTNYSCLAAFSRIRHMAQKTPISLKIHNSGLIKNRAPKIMTTQGGANNPIVVLKDEVLLLECIAEGLPTPTIHWRKEEDDSLKHHIETESFGKILKIKKVTKEDQGTYHCEAKNQMGSTHRSFHVHVEEPPRWEKQLESSIQTVGSEIILNCSALGTPEPQIRWRRNGVLLDGGTLPDNHQRMGGLLFIHSLQVSDSAIYQCEASNKHGTILSTANIDVLDIIPLILTPEGRTYTAVWGNNISLLCENFAFPLADVTWYHGKRIVHPVSGRYTIDEHGTLHIHKAEAQDAGSYICEVSNSKGNASVMANVVLREPTRGYVSPEHPWVKRGHSITLTCHIHCDPHLLPSQTITWRRDNQEIREDNKRIHVKSNILTIYNVSWDDAGTYYCIVTTLLDTMTAEVQVTVRDVPMPPENLRLLEKHERSILLSWAAGDSHNSPITEFIIQSIKNIEEAGQWDDETSVPGNVTTVQLYLSPYFNYQFRVLAVNGIGKSPPSVASEIYSTPPAVPDKNPHLVYFEANSPDEITVRWEPLNSDEHNGPGLEYQVSWRLKGVETEWHHRKVKHTHYIIRNTPAFVPYEIYIQTVNEIGRGPEPEIHAVYSGEDNPDAAPGNVSVSVLNQTIVNVTWMEISQDRIRGHLAGYKIIYWRVKGLQDGNPHHGQRHVLSFPGKRNWAIVPKLHPFSEYQLCVAAYNTKGVGPESSTVTFQTPEGVPEQPQYLQIANSDMESFMLTWEAPKRTNGILTSYVLYYQMINESNGVGNLSNITITNLNALSQKVPRLEVGTRYKFYLQACTRVGCGKPVSEEGLTLAQATYANAPHSLSSQGWFIGLMCAVALLTLLMLVACFIQRNRGGKYAVKEKEELHPAEVEVEVQSIKEQFFDDISDKKAINGSMDSVSLDIKTLDSVDSLVQYSDGEHSHFNEDGSFIGAYSESKDKGPDEETSVRHFRS